MQVKQRTTLELFSQVNSFIDSNPTVLANAPDGYDEQVDNFKTALSVVQRATAEQVTQTPTQTAAQRQAARQAVRIGQLHPLRKIARVLERSVAGMPHLVTVPKKAGSTQALIAAAKAVVQDVTPYEAQFISKGMPPDFLDQLNQSIQVLQNVDSANVAAKQVTKRAQGQLATAVLEAKDAVTCMDVIIRRVCAADPVNGGATLAVWDGIVPPPAKLVAVGSLTSGASGTASGGPASGSTTSGSTTSGSTTSAGGGGTGASGDTGSASTGTPPVGDSANTGSSSTSSGQPVSTASGGASA